MNQQRETVVTASIHAGSVRAAVPLRGSSPTGKLIDALRPILGHRALALWMAGAIASQA